MQPAWSAQDVAGMQAALAQARNASSAGEIPVGAAVVREGKVVAVAHNCSVTDHDPCGHAEIIALRSAGGAAGNYRLTDTTLYVTLEPCVMCVGAIVQARVVRVVFGAYDKKAGALGGALDLTESRVLNHRFEVNGGLMAEAAEALLHDFFSARR